MTGSPTVVRVQDVSKRFVIRKEKSLKERLVNFGRSNRHKEDFWALRNVNVEIGAGSTVGLIGANGSGKSTLLKLIGGILHPTSGTVEHRGRIAALLELGAGFHPDLTGRENVYLNASILGLTTKQTNKYFDAIVDFSGIEPFIDTQVKFYSSGMYVRLAFAVAVHVDPDVLLVDEVLSVGDEPFQRKCMDRIREFQSEGRTIIVVTHSMDQVADLCDRAIVLDHGNVEVDGDPIDALRHLRSDFEEMRREDISREQHDSLEPQTAARVTAVRITDHLGRPLDAITTGGDVDVHLDITADGTLDHPLIGVGIDNSLGQTVYATSTKMMQLAIPEISGSRSFTFRLPHLALNEGQYDITGTIYRTNGTEIHRYANGAPLSVETLGHSFGFIDVRATLLEHEDTSATVER
ncbi:ABC transporter ATP-binding protein [Nakamurella lactea]|uniref:ABC transporter ATP-binding protein n=1 Tax=Nakamurella lactea TaxID=459515 RepID=UPI00041EE759|nr:ABC transporter ATP-binding protein [Nakamurella lactea]